MPTCLLRGVFLNRGFPPLSLFVGAPLPTSWIVKRGLLLELFLFTTVPSSMTHTACGSRMKDMGGIKTQETCLWIIHSFGDDFLPRSTCRHLFFQTGQRATSFTASRVLVWFLRKDKAEEASSIHLNCPVCQTRGLMVDDVGRPVT